MCRCTTCKGVVSRRLRRQVFFHIGCVLNQDGGLHPGVNFLQVLYGAFNNGGTSRQEAEVESAILGQQDLSGNNLPAICKLFTSHGMVGWPIHASNLLMLYRSSMRTGSAALTMPDMAFQRNNYVGVPSWGAEPMILRVTSGVGSAVVFVLSMA